MAKLPARLLATSRRSQCAPSMLSDRRAAIAWPLRRGIRAGAHCLRDQRGVAAVEFAILFPALALITLGAIELGIAMFAQHTLESAAFDASRVGKTGFAANGNFNDQLARELAMHTALNRRVGALFDTQRIAISTKSYAQFSDIGQPEPFMDANANGTRDNGENFTDVNANGQYDTDMGVSNLGQAKSVVVYTISYPWTVTTPGLSHLLGENGVMNLSARAVVLNEPF